MKTPYFSVFIPSYNNSSTIADTLKSVLDQSFTDFKIVISDDCSRDNTLEIVSRFKDKRISITKHPVNLGYSGNLNQSFSLCKSNLIFILAGDDLIDTHTLQWYYDALKKYPKAGAITRPYYWFETNYRLPIRQKETVSSKSDIAVTTDSSIDQILLVLSSLDQCSGLCFNKNLATTKFSPDPWISHAYPWLNIFKHHPVIYLNRYSLAVRIGHSATRTNIYQKSPMLNWKNLIDCTFSEDKYFQLRQNIISNFIGTNFVGLVQIKNYGSFTSYLREVKYLILFNPKNLLNYKFWFYFLVTLLTPPMLLRIVADKYKAIVNSRFIDQNVVIDLLQ